MQFSGSQHDVDFPSDFDEWYDLMVIATWTPPTTTENEEAPSDEDFGGSNDDWRLYVDRDWQYEDEDEDDDFEFEDSHWIDVDGKFYPSNIVRYRQRRVQQERIIKYKKNLELS